MALASLKVSAAASVQGQTQPGTVQLKSVKVTQQKTTGMVLIPGGGFAGNVARPWVTKSAGQLPYTMSPSDGGVLATGSGTITLPASPIVGQSYGVKGFAAGAAPVVAVSGGVIDSGGLDATSLTLSPGSTATFTVAPNGTDWVIVTLTLPAVSEFLPWALTSVDRQLTPGDSGVVCLASCMIGLPIAALMPAGHVLGVKSAGAGISPTVTTTLAAGPGIPPTSVIDPFGVNASQVTVLPNTVTYFAPDPDGVNWMRISDQSTGGSTISAPQPLGTPTLA